MPIEVESVDEGVAQSDKGKEINAQAQFLESPESPSIHIQEVGGSPIQLI